MIIAESIQRHAALGEAMLSINAAKGFEYGIGLDGVGQRGSQQNDAFFNDHVHHRLC